MHISKFNNFEGAAHLQSLSYLFIHFIFDIDVCYFDIERERCVFLHHS